MTDTELQNLIDRHEKRKQHMAEWWNNVSGDEMLEVLRCICVTVPGNSEEAQLENLIHEMALILMEQLVITHYRKKVT